MKAWKYAYKHRRQKKRDFRTLWIARINAACRELGTTYSRFINALTKSNLKLNRKVLADLAVTDKDAFKKLVSQVKAA
jgi:large subunit ribosomal protein L20